jgi:hypothetical protein
MCILLGHDYWWSYIYDSWWKMMRYTFKPEDKVFGISRNSHFKNIVSNSVLPWLPFCEKNFPLIRYPCLLKTEVFTSTIVRSLFS